MLNQYEEAIEYNVEKVSLMTLHASKGLEFSVVFIVGCEEQILPLNFEEMTGELEEERRLFYVGMTRAKQMLYLLSATKRMLYGKTLNNPPCRFIANIKEELKAYERSTGKRKAAPVEQQMNLF